MSLDIDVQPLFDSINTFFPVFFPVMALIGGIAIALALSKFVIEEIRRAF